MPRREGMLPFQRRLIILSTTSIHAETSHGPASSFCGLRRATSTNAAKFYGDVFGLKRHGREDLSIGSAVYMGDGTINLALLNFKGTKGHDFGDKPEGQIGANHFGFQVENMKDTQALIEANGGKFFFDLGDERKGNFERKFKDPEGIIFDISENGWVGTDSRKIKADREHAFLDETLVKPEAAQGPDQAFRADGARSRKSRRHSTRRCSA